MHHLVYLTKFGNIQNMKVDNLKHPFHIVGNCCDFLGNYFLFWKTGNFSQNILFSKYFL
jgi:hypothetical protein